MIIQIIVLVVLIFINAILSGSEMALVSVNDNKLNMLVQENNKKALLLKKLLDEPSRFLATIQIGITLAGFLASAFASEGFSDYFVNMISNTNININADVLKVVLMVLITLVLAYFTLVFGELVPKRIAMKKALKISMFMAKPLVILSYIALPFVKILTISTNIVSKLFGINPTDESEEITEEEIRFMVGIGEEKGTIEENERVMINNIFEFNNKTVKEIMTHRMDIKAISVNSNYHEVIAFLNEERFSRLPVYKDSIDNILGILYVRDIIPFISNSDAFNLNSILREPLYIPYSMKTDILFKKMQKNSIHFAIIIDEYGGTEGIVTLEDLIEEIVGNIYDEHDDYLDKIEIIEENSYLVDGSISITDFEAYFVMKFDNINYDTISGFIIEQIGRIPNENETISITYKNLSFVVNKVEDKRIKSVKVNII